MTSLDAFRAAFGRLCVLCAFALFDAHPREAVRVAFMGSGRGRDQAHIRAQRRVVNREVAAVKGSSDSVRDAVIEMVRVARAVRTAVEQEWMLTLPTMGAMP